MSFISYEFAILLAACLIAYACLQRRAQNVVLLVASYVFYGAWDVRFLALLGASTVWDFWIAGRIFEAKSSPDPKSAKRWLVLALSVSLGVLTFFKYFGFFTHEAAAALKALGVPVSMPVLEITLPIGISFYTFQSISYVVDIYRGQMQPARSLLDFATFIAFFPQLVAGPIERAKHMLPQFASPRRVTLEDFREGTWLMLIGYVRKVVIADTAAKLAEPYFATPAKHSSVELACGLLLFSLQIYGDFAGYTDIARGTARLFGFKLMRNFEHPYFARSIAEFWRRWHISLSTWLRDYLYIALGGNRRGEARTYLALMVTMLLGGLWHGASWNFLIWGGLHGLYLCVHRALRAGLDKLQGSTAFSLLPARAALGWVLTFGLVSFTWLFFRSTDMATTSAYLSGLAKLDLSDANALVPPALLAALTLLIDVPQAIGGEELRWARMPRLARVSLAAALVTLLLASQDTGQPFIYFQF
jgi:D-alanyl-lipoteichoic acid acyltransferase DltB (MBOAT superfamily)